MVKDGQELSLVGPVESEVSLLQVVEPAVKAFLYTWGKGRTTAEGEHIPARIEQMEIGYIDGMLVRQPSVSDTGPTAAGSQQTHYAFVGLHSLWPLGSWRFDAVEIGCNCQITLTCDLACSCCQSSSSTPSTSAPHFVATPSTPSRR